MNDFFNCGVYRWLNTVNGKSYVGSAVEIDKRRGTHIWALRRNRHHSIKLQRAWDKYGAAAFEFEILAFCPKEDLLWHEQRAIDAFDVISNGYNVCPIAGRNGAGIKLSNERRRQQSVITKALWASEEFRERQSESRRASWTEERRQEMGKRVSKRNLSRVYPPDMTERMREMANKLWEDPEFQATMAASWTSERKDGMRTIMAGIGKSGEGNHQRWHVARGTKNAECSFCQGEA